MIARYRTWNLLKLFAIKYVYYYFQYTMAFKNILTNIKLLFLQQVNEPIYIEYFNNKIELNLIVNINLCVSTSIIVINQNSRYTT